MRERVLKQGTIWFRSRLLIQDPDELLEPSRLPSLPDGSKSPLPPPTSHWETEDWAGKR